MKALKIFHTSNSPILNSQKLMYLLGQMLREEVEREEEEVEGESWTKLLGNVRTLVVLGMSH